MSNQVYIARLNFGTKGDGSQSQITVGVFSTRKLAEESLENFIEGTLEMEYPNIVVISQIVEEFVLDEPIDKSPLIDPENPDEIPF